MNVTTTPTTRQPPAIRKETIERTFGHIKVSIEFFEEAGEQRALGDVSCIDPVTGAELGGSLDMLFQTHTLEDWVTWGATPVNRRLVEEIEAWATEEGY